MRLLRGHSETTQTLPLDDAERPAMSRMLGLCAVFALAALAALSYDLGCGVLVFAGSLVAYASVRYVARDQLDRERLQHARQLQLAIDAAFDAGRRARDAA